MTALPQRFYFYGLSQHLPRWAALEHPVVKRELGVWQNFMPRWEKMFNNVWFFLLFAPLGLSIIIGAVVIIGTFYNARAMLPFVGSLWALQLLPSLGLKTFAALGSSFLITHERETLNWNLLRLTPLPTDQIVRAKIAGLLHWLTEPILMLVGMRLMTALATAAVIVRLSQQSFVSTGVGLAFNFQPTAIITVSGLALIIFLASLLEIATSLFYNCSVGVLASTLARSSSTAIVLTFTGQLTLWLFIFLPAQQLSTPYVLNGLGGLLNLSVLEIVVPLGISLLVPIALEVWIAFTVFSFALSRAQNIVD